MTKFVFIGQNVQDTERLGAALAETLPDRTVVGLSGTLGAGKTRLVQAVAAECGLKPGEVTSPTFVLCQEYHGERSVYHFDVYRLKDDAEFLALGPDEYFNSPGITFIEWADRVVDCLPPARMEINIHVTGEETREFEIRVQGARYESVLEKIRERLTSDTSLTEG